MDALTAEGIFLFEGFRLDPEAGGLFQRGDAGVFVPVALGSRALDLLVLLVTRRGDLVSKDEILSAVWPGLTVADSNLPTQIWALRRVLDQGRIRRSCIQTWPAEAIALSHRWRMPRQRCFQQAPGSRPPLQPANPSSRRRCRSSCCHLRISAPAPISITLQTRSPTI